MEKQMCSIDVDLSVWILCRDYKKAYPNLVKVRPSCFLLKIYNQIDSNIYQRRKIVYDETLTG